MKREIHLVMSYCSKKGHLGEIEILEAFYDYDEAIYFYEERLKNQGKNDSVRIDFQTLYVRNIL